MLRRPTSPAPVGGGRVGGGPSRSRRGGDVLAEFDAVVVGAGTAGLNAAAQLARRGLRTAILERRPIGTGGARWRNGVLHEQFARAGVARPEPVEDPVGSRTFLLDPDGEVAVVLADPPAVDVDMRVLNERLVAVARTAGVEVLDRIDHVEVLVDGGRVRGLDVTTADGGVTRLEAALVVDAGGRDAPVGSSSGLLGDGWRPVPPAELCSAAQFTHAVTDPAGAAAFLDRHGAAAGDTVTRLGADGGFSALAVGVERDLTRLSILTGTVAGGPWGSGRDVLDRFLAAAPWVGAAEFGGAGLIPLRRPQNRFTAPGLALVGDAASQVFPAHGSGIGIGLIAGTVLAEQVAGAADPGSEEATWAYQAAFQREFGGTLAAFDVMRRFNSAIGTDGVRRLVRSGFFSETVARDGLAQRWSVPPAAESAASVRRMVTQPGIGAPMAAALARAAAVRSLYRAHPARPDATALRRWSAAVARLVGPSVTR